MDQVEEDLRRMKITGWRVKIADRQVWNRIVEQTKTHQGCRVNRRRRRIRRRHDSLLEISFKCYLPK